MTECERCGRSTETKYDKFCDPCYWAEQKKRWKGDVMPRGAHIPAEQLKLVGVLENEIITRKELIIAVRVLAELADSMSHYSLPPQDEPQTSKEPHAWGKDATLFYEMLHKMEPA